MHADSHARRVETIEELRGFLAADPITFAYQLGDLGDAYFPFTTWYGSGAPGHLQTLMLVYTGLSLPVIITAGPTDGLTAIMDTFSEDLPGRAMLHMQPDHLEVIHRDLVCEKLHPMVRMGLKVDDFLPRKGGAPGTVEVLSMSDIGDIMALYRYYPDSFFEPAQLSTGHYYGVRHEGRLVSVAGVHVFSPQARVACLGNIVTHPDFRGRGLSTGVTSHLCAKLAAEGVDVFALNVDRHNSSAVRVYEKLGFREHATYLEGEATAPLRRLA